MSAAITEPTKKTREIVNEQKKQLGFSEESELAESINACFPSTLTNVISSRPSDDNKKFSALEQLKYQVLLTMIFSEKANYLFSLDGKIALNSKLSQEMKNAYEAKLTQLMTVVLTPVCIATIQALRELPLSDSTISLSKRYTLICQLITAAVTDKKIVQIIMQENQIDLEKLVGKKENLGLDSLDDEPSSQDKKDFMECFAYVIHELPRYLLQAPPTITFKQLVTFSSENKTYVAALVNAAKQLPSLAEGDENAEETPIKRRYPVSGVKA